MDLAAGTRLGPYEVVSAIGAGGMGEVYRARDTRLNRVAAIKILSRQFSADPDRLTRFEREARTLATLNHPNIAQIYGTEREGDVHALAMEFVDGEDLSQMLARGPLPIDEAVAIARQIADALAAAHEHGIVHRDLKPANVKVRPDGMVKVLDFGLAKSMGASDVTGASHPTLTSPAMTQVGVILGTAAYMSPEQAKGKAVDRGSDMWAFGAVLYEMLVGRPAFTGETVTDVLAAIVTREPEWSALPLSTPDNVHRLLSRCLERDRRRRLADAGEARFQLEEAPVVPRPVTWSWSDGAARTALPWAIVALLAAAVAVLAIRGPRQPALETSRFNLELPAKVELPFASRPALAVSADGRTIVFVGSIDGVERLFVRRVDSFEATEIPGTQTASLPAISPDGRSVAFSTSTKLAKVSIDGGPVTILADTVEARGVSWDVDDSIVFVPRAVGGIFRVPAAGGQASEISTPASNAERTHRWPQQLPDGALIFTVDSDATPDNYDDASVVAQMPDGSRHVVLPNAAMARYADGRLVFARGGTLFAVGFDARRAVVSGTPVEIVQQVAGDATTGAHHFAVSASGTLVYVSGRNAPGSTSPGWATSRTFEALSLQPGAYSGPRISPDGQQMAVTIGLGSGGDIWVHHFGRRTFTKVTFGGDNVTPLWSRDGATLYYTQLDTVAARSTIMRRPADGSREAEVVATLPGRVYLDDVTLDDRGLIVNVYGSPEPGPNGPGRAWIGTLPLAKGAEVVPVRGETDAYNVRLSPNGRWLAYVGMYPNREIYVRSTAGSGRWQVSTDGGEEPKWSKDGRRLYFRNDNELYAVTLDPRAAAFEATAPTLVLRDIYNLRSEHGISYDVDGTAERERFLMLRPAEEAADALALRVITNWAAAIP